MDMDKNSDADEIGSQQRMMAFRVYTEPITPARVEFNMSFGPKPCRHEEHKERDENGCLRQQTDDPIDALHHANLLSIMAKMP